MGKYLLTAAACLLLATDAWAESATVVSGVKSEITTHVRYDSRCMPTRVAVTFLTPPKNGTVTVEPKSIAIAAAASERNVPQPSQCVGKTVEGVAVYYQSNPGFVGQDSFRYQRLNPRDAGDRFNAELTYVITVTAAGDQAQSEIEKLNATFVELFNKGDAAGVAALYADDAVVLPPGAGIVKGRAAIEAFWKGAAETLGDAKLTTLEVRPFGENAAREIGYFSLHSKSSPAQELTGKYVVVWERVGSQWKLGTDIWNEGK